MPEEALPLFPLSVVLFPRAPLPLHIFEERYKEMIGEAIARGSEFGVVLTAGQAIVNIGCTAMVENVVRRYPDGRMDILTRGRRRFRIQSVDREKACLQGTVEFFDDEPEPAQSGLRRQALAAWRNLPEEQQSAASDLEDPQLSFQLATAIDDLGFRQELLAERSESNRLRRLIEMLPRQAARRQHTEHARQIAPRNGHGRGGQPS